jgi:hypothetical protein
MFREINARLAPVAAPEGGAHRRYEPYAGQSANALYNLLFCDDFSAFKGAPGQPPLRWQQTLFSMPADVLALQDLACDLSQEGRIRYLAFSRLRETGHAVLPKLLLGVVAEVSLPGGLDALAAFRGGGVRYVNPSEKILVTEGSPRLDPLVERLFAAAEAAVARIGPWDRPRLAPPAQGNIRLSFLVSDGLYFCEGFMPAMQRDAAAGPIMGRATELLRAITATEAEQAPLVEP